MPGGWRHGAWWSPLQSAGVDATQLRWVAASLGFPGLAGHIAKSKIAVVGRSVDTYFLLHKWMTPGAGQIPSHLYHVV